MVKKALPLILLLFGSSPLWAQGDSSQWEAGFMLGKILPHQIDGVTEIMSLGGLQVGYRLAPMTYIESFFHMGNGEDQSWKNLGVSARMDLPLEDFLVGAYGGIHSTLSKGHGTSENSEFGGHAGGALMTGIGGPTWLRMDMNFSFGPGTSLLISMALLLRF